ncbi:MAG TPA: hypothetical protein VLA54_08705, partial [Acidimicrobiia bacterium]|nr:hypothetical protein [Acidimicrobiia bacterium]
ARLFADGRSDIAGVVLVDPMPVGFPDVLDRETSAAGHPPWADLDAAVSTALNDFGAKPLVIIGHDPAAVFLTSRFTEAFGAESGRAINAYWQDSLEFYAGLSTDSRTVVAPRTGLEMIVWDRPDLVVEEVLGVLGLASG